MVTTAAVRRPWWAGGLVVERHTNGVPPQPIDGPVELGQRAVQPQALVARMAVHYATSLQTGQTR
jgi:hypothetical protein